MARDSLFRESAGITQSMADPVVHLHHPRDRNMEAPGRAMKAAIALLDMSLALGVMWMLLL